MSLFSRLVVGTAESPPIHRLITRTRAGRRLAHRFVAGETLDEAAEVARRLNRAGMTVSLDLLGEEVTASDEVEQAYEGYEECLKRIADDGLDELDDLLDGGGAEEEPAGAGQVKHNDDADDAPGQLAGG